MALSDKNIVITPNISATADPKIVFSAADANTTAQNITLTAYPTNSGTLSFDGSAGQLFSITNSLSGSIFSVNDISGIPSIEVLDTGTIKLAQYGGYVGIGLVPSGTYKLEVLGSISGNTITSTVANGVAPFTVISNTQVINLNASLLGGLNSGYYLSLANVVYGAANAAMVLSNTTFTYANAYLTTANAYNSNAILAYAAANAAMVLSNVVYGAANNEPIAKLAFAYANAYLTTANTYGVNALSAFSQANLVFAYANAYLTTANTYGVNALSAFSQANLVFAYANAYLTTANTYGVNALSAFSQANLVFAYANAYLTTANAYNSNAILAYAAANAAMVLSNVVYGAANNEPIAKLAFAYANAYLTTANTYGVNALSAFSQANLVFAYANAYLTTANAYNSNAILAYAAANAAMVLSNVVYGAANAAMVLSNVVYGAANSALNAGIGALVRTNNSITLGSTPMYLGGTNTTIAGLTSVTSTQFIGSLFGNANTSSNVALGAANNIPYQTGSGITNFITIPTTNDTYLKWNAFGFSWATAAGGIAVANDTTTAATFYPMFTSLTTGTLATANISSSKLQFNPSTGTFYSTIFQSLSDENQKTNIIDISNATNTVNSIKGVEFNWKETGKHSSGIIAQQLETILPFLVDTDLTGNKSVNYNGIIGYLIEAVKELTYRVEELENK